MIVTPSGFDDRPRFMLIVPINVPTATNKPVTATTNLVIVLIYSNNDCNVRPKPQTMKATHTTAETLNNSAVAPTLRTTHHAPTGCSTTTNHRQPSTQDQQTHPFPQSTNQHQPKPQPKPTCVPTACLPRYHQAPSTHHAPPPNHAD